MTKPQPQDLHRQITEAIVSAIEAGAGEYRMPWHPPSGLGAFSPPHNPIGGYKYRGINVLSLWCAQQTKGYGSSQWASYRQWLTAGRQVRRGETGTITVTYSELPPVSARLLQKIGDSDTLVPRRVVLVRSGMVFNADQVDGAAPLPDGGVAREPLPVAAALLSNAGAVIRPNRRHACYVPATDEIHLPPRAAFVSDHAYFGVAFHELTHWTGHPTRCARDLTGRFGSNSYAVEELIAELGSAFLSAEVGLATVPRLDHARYIESWLRVLKTDTKAVFLAVGRATEAASYLLSQVDSNARKASL